MSVPAAARRALLALAAGLLIAGCAALPREGTAPVEASQRTLREPFTLLARVAASEGQRSASFSLDWRHAVRRDEWTLSGPLGQVLAEIVSEPGSSHMTTASGERLEAARAGMLAQRLLGFEFPLEGLAYWVQGVPREGGSVKALDATGRPARIADAGWIIDYLEYGGGEPDALPKRIEANWGDARLKLVVDAWEFQP